MLFTQGKINWKYILVVLILAVVAGGGILFWIKTQEIPVIEFPEIKKPEKVVEDETANWKIHRNNEYRFEAKYPDGWEWKEQKHEEVTEIVFEKKESRFLCVVHFLRVIPKLPFEELIAGQKNAIQKRFKIEINEKVIVVDKILAIKLSYFIPGELVSPYSGEGQQIHRIFIPLTGNETFQIGYYADEKENEECESIFNQMLTTFRFLE